MAKFQGGSMSRNYTATYTRIEAGYPAIWGKSSNGRRS